MIFKTNRIPIEEPSLCKSKPNLRENSKIYFDERKSETFGLNPKAQPKILFKAAKCIIEDKKSFTEIGTEFQYEEETSNFFQSTSLSNVMGIGKNISNKTEMFVSYKAIQPEHCNTVQKFMKKPRREEIKLRSRLASKNSKNWIDNEYNKEYSIGINLRRDLINKHNRILELENELELLQSTNKRLVIVSNFGGFRGICGKCMIPLAILGIIGLIICSVLTFPLKLETAALSENSSASSSVYDSSTINNNNYESGGSSNSPLDAAATNTINKNQLNTNSTTPTSPTASVSSLNQFLG